jgi:mitogen-activated protein kinase kinase
VSNRIVALLGSTELASRTGKVEVYMEYMDSGYDLCLLVESGVLTPSNYRSLDGVLAAAGTIPIPMLRHIAKSVVEALLYLANKLHMVHRGVRPARMFLNSRGEVKLGGFRLSTRFDHRSASATESNLKLMRCYSPERAGSSSPSIKDDVWSLGISLFEMAAGKHPYSAYRSHGDLLNAIAIEPAPRLRDRDDLTPQFHILIAKCLTRVEERASLRQLQVELTS